ncbi:hypothetical protein BU15DRAFT_83627 [Melanogaster broomeanus]|nr:hypothetical protein BU15DRAFT_83627 [Melanogaster broomeanus]
MNKPLPALPKHDDLVNGRNALSLAGKEDSTKNNTHPPVTVTQPVYNRKSVHDIQRHPPVVSPAVRGRAAPPPPDELVDALGALSLAGKEDNAKNNTRPPVTQPVYNSSFIGGFSPGLIAKPIHDIQRHPPVVPPAIDGRPGEPLPPPRTPSKLPSMPVPQVAKHSLTMQHALSSMPPHTPSKPAPLGQFFTPPPRPPQLGSLLSSTANEHPSISALGPSCPHPMLFQGGRAPPRSLLFQEQTRVQHNAVP